MFSFNKRKAQNDVHGALRRIVDRTTPNLTPLSGPTRCNNRHNRTLPVLISSWDGQSLGSDGSILGLTKDISDLGLAAVLTQPLSDQSVAVTFWLASGQAVDGEPVTILGNTRHCLEIGGGFWQIGIELSERLDNREVLDELEPLARQLLPAPKQTAIPAAH